jgi:hypothetical protein
MNRKLGHLIKAAIFALPLALPGVALAQTADTNTPGAQDDANKGSVPQDKSNVGNSNAQGSSGMNSGGTLDQTDKQNAGSLGTSPGTSDTNPPAGKLDTSGSSTSGDRGVGGDINKSNDSNMSSETTTTHKKSTKKSTKRSSPSDSDTSGDINR